MYGGSQLVAKFYTWHCHPFCPNLLHFLKLESFKMKDVNERERNEMKEMKLDKEKS